MFASYNNLIGALTDHSSITTEIIESFKSEDVCFDTSRLIAQSMACDALFVSEPNDSESDCEWKALSSVSSESEEDEDSEML